MISKESSVITEDSSRINEPVEDITRSNNKHKTISFGIPQFINNKIKKELISPNNIDLISYTKENKKNLSISSDKDYLNTSANKTINKKKYHKSNN